MNLSNGDTLQVDVLSAREKLLFYVKENNLNPQNITIPDDILDTTIARIQRAERVLRVTPDYYNGIKAMVTEATKRVTEAKLNP